MRAVLIWAATVTAAAATATGGYFATIAFGQDEPKATRTVTIDVSTGPQGETGPQGPPGPAGADGAGTCPAGFSFGEAVFIQQAKGPVTLFACIKDE